MAVDGTRLPFDVVDGRTIFFHMHSRRAETAREELAKQVEHINGGAFKASNPITEALDIISLEGSGQPVERALASIMGRLDTLNGAVATMQAAARHPFQFIPPFIRRGADVTLYGANEPTILGSALGAQTRTVLDDEEPKEPR
jgi:hypothetical protein